MQLDRIVFYGRNGAGDPQVVGVITAQDVFDLLVYTEGNVSSLAIITNESTIKRLSEELSNRKDK